nr:zf-CCHC domain-containing protein/UBN2 domain-containing protein [Tanacetum cinerariifolium]
MKFLRALPTKWCPKVMTIEESKDLSTLPLDAVISNVKVYEVVLGKDFETFRNKKVKYKSLSLKATKVLSEEEATSSDSNYEEYAMVVRDFKKFFRRRGKFVRQPHDDKRNFQKAKEDKKKKDDQRCFKCGDPNHFISDCPKHFFNDQKAFVVGCWSDNEDDSKKEEICLMALDDSEKPPKNIHGIGYTDYIASTRNMKPKKLDLKNAEILFVEPALLVPAASEPASSNEQNRPTAVKMENAKNLRDNIVKKNDSVLVTRKSSFNTSKSVKQPPILKLGQGLGK